MLDIFVRKPLASWTLRQAHICSSRSSVLRGDVLLCILTRHRRYRSCFWGVGSGRRALVRFVAAVEDMVQLGHWVAALDADGHAICGVALWIRSTSRSIVNDTRSRGSHLSCYTRWDDFFVILGVCFVSPLNPSMRS